MTRLYAWLVKKLGQVGAVILLAVLAILIVGGIYQGVKSFFTAGLETQVKTQKGQTEAFGKSAEEAVGTIGNRQQAEQHGAANVQEAQGAINNATDVSGATGAGLDGLHRVRRRPTPSPSR